MKSSRMLSHYLGLHGECGTYNHFIKDTLVDIASDAVEWFLVQRAVCRSRFLPASGEIRQTSCEHENQF